MYRILFVILFLTSCVFAAAAQNPDTTAVTLKSKADTISSTRRDTVSKKNPKVKREKLYSPDSTHNPRKAVIRSLIVPGLGQIYNHRIWKVPIIYGGLGLLGWAIVYNAHYYNEYLTLSKYREHGIVPGVKDSYYNEYNEYANVPTQALYDATDSYRRDRDLAILGTLGAWGINAIDAYIDAKFIHSYTVDNDLSFRVSPRVLIPPAYAQISGSSFIPGINITFTLK